MLESLPETLMDGLLAIMSLTISLTLDIGSDMAVGLYCGLKQEKNSLQQPSLWLDVHHVLQVAEDEVVHPCQ